MIEVQLVRSPAHRTLAAVALPYFELHLRGDYAAPGSVNLDGTLEVVFALDGGEPELKYGAVAVLLGPRVVKVENCRA